MTKTLQRVAPAMRLRQLEKVIAKGLARFIEVGKALQEIRDSELYKVDYRTFEDYCQRRWNLGANYAYKHIQAAEVAEKMCTIVHTAPPNEAQARELVGLSDDKLKQVAERVDFSRTTAKEVRRVVADLEQTRDSYEEPSICLHKRTVLVCRDCGEELE